MDTFEKRLSKIQSPGTKRVKGDISWTMDRDFNIVSWNYTFKSLACEIGIKTLPANFFDIKLSEEQESTLRNQFEKAFNDQSDSFFLTSKLSLNDRSGYLNFVKMIDPSSEKLLCTFSAVDEEHDHNFLLQLLEKLSAPEDESRTWFWSVDNEGILTSISKSSEKITGYTKEERIGNHILGTRNEKQQKELLKFVDSHAKRPRPFDNLYLGFTAKNGKHLYVKSAGVPHYDERGNLTGYSGTTTDITLERQLHEKLLSSEKLNRAMVETLPDSFMILTSRGILLDYHPYNAEDDLGLNEESIGKSLDKLLKTKKSDFLLAPIEKVLETGKIISLNVELENSSGTPLDYEMRYIPMENSKDQVLVVIRNITESKEAQKELIKSMNELSLSNRELEQFAYTVSHDLQEPMRLVSSYLQLIKMKSRDQLDEKSNSYLAMAIQSSDQMRNLVTNLLEYSRLGQQKLKVSSIDFDRMMESLRLIFVNKLQQTGGKIDVGEIPDFVCDSLHFSLLMQNLIGNALKFHKKDEPPVVKISGREAEHDHVVLCVADNGVGMEQEITDKVFGAFERLNGTAHIEGHGLGMSICRKIVHSHGGKIWIESQPGKGTQVFFTMPTDQSQIPSKD